MQTIQLSERTRGCWLSILPAIGIRSEFLTGKNGPCPFCGGKDRWRFTNKDGSGTWICNQCGAGSGIELVKRALNMDFHDAALHVERMLADVRPDPVTQRDDVKCRDAAKRAWEAASPLCDDDAVVRYLRGRAIDFPTWPKALRSAVGGASGKMMLAKIVSPKDEAVSIHRTFLPSGQKKFMQGAIPPGSAIRLFPHVGILGVAEGIETALSVYLLFGVPCWAASSAGGMEKFAPPKEVRAVCLYGDNDASCTGQAAAWVAAKRLRAQGLSVDVKIPDTTDCDWNDVLKAGRL